MKTKVHTIGAYYPSNMTERIKNEIKTVKFHRNDGKAKFHTNLTESSIKRLKNLVAGMLFDGVEQVNFGTIVYTVPVPVTVSKQGLTEVDYRDILRKLYEWFSDNVDKYDDEEGMDQMWHLTGAIVARQGDFWTRSDHANSFLRVTRFPLAWKELFERAK
jgi:hypothetical protein